MSDREVIFKFKLTSHRGVKTLLVGAECGYSLTKVDDPNDRKCEPDWKLLGLWKIHCPLSDGSIQENMQVEHQVLPLGPKLFTTFKATVTKILLESSLL